MKNATAAELRKLIEEMEKHRTAQHALLGRAIVALKVAATALELKPAAAKPAKKAQKAASRPRNAARSLPKAKRTARKVAKKITRREAGMKVAKTAREKRSLVNAAVDGRRFARKPATKPNGAHPHDQELPFAR